MKRLLIIGASILQLPAIKKAKELGFYVGVADYNPNAIGIPYADEYFNVSTIDEEGVCEAARAFGADGIMTLATDMPMRSVAYACQKLGLVGISYDTAVKSTDKGEMIKAFEANGVEHPWYYILETPEQAEAVLDRITYPCITKPTDNSGSRGVMLVNNREELDEALNIAKKYESAVLIEQRIFGREFTQAYLDNTTLPPVEIIPKCGFYDYANKYVANATEEICPANISPEQLEAISSATAIGFEALRLDGYARFDYILDAENRFWCLEANTLPGMTPTSLLPQEAAAVGIYYDSLCDKLAKMALRKKHS